MSHTLVRLDGELMDIEDLIEVLPNSNWAIENQSDGYYITSNQLNSLTNNREVIAKTQETLDILNGAANLRHRNHQNVTPGNIVRVDDSGRHHYIILTDSITVRSQVNRDNSARGWVSLSETNQAVHDVLYFFNEITWFNLYKIYEIICKDVCGEKNLEKFMTRDELVSFRQTAQSREAIGKLARHGKQIPAPQKKMNFDEAYDLWKRVFETWVNSKS